MEYQKDLQKSMKYNTPFDPDFKYMATCVNLEGGVVRLLVKGAPEKLKVNRMVNEDGTIGEFD